jgi:pimeloyl-ACP methyl ester carboxylesterase
VDTLFATSRGQGSTIVFLHGWSHSHLIWSKVLPRFEHDHRCLMVDLPGFGGSNGYHLPEVSLETYAKAVLEHLKTMLKDRDVFSFIGDSLGALVVMKILESGVFNTQKTVLCGCPVNGLPHLLQLGKINNLISGSMSLLKHIPKSVLPHVVKAFSAITVADHRVAYEDITNSLLQLNPVTAEKIYRAIAGRNHFDFNSIRHGCRSFLVVSGQKDRVVSRSDSMTLSRSLDCEHIEIPGAGHTPMQEQPEAFSDIIHRFFNYENENGGSTDH